MRKWVLATLGVWILVFGVGIALAVTYFQKDVPGNTVVIPTPAPAVPNGSTTLATTVNGLSPTNPVGTITVTNQSDYAITLDTVNSINNLPAAIGTIAVSGGTITARGSGVVTVTFTPVASPAPGTYTFTLSLVYGY